VDQKEIRKLLPSLIIRHIKRCSRQNQVSGVRVTWSGHSVAPLCVPCIACEAEFR